MRKILLLVVSALFLACVPEHRIFAADGALGIQWGLSIESVVKEYGKKNMVLIDGGVRFTKMKHLDHSGTAEFLFDEYNRMNEASFYYDNMTVKESSELLATFGNSFGHFPVGRAIDNGYFVTWGTDSDSDDLIILSSVEAPGTDGTAMSVTANFSIRPEAFYSNPITGFREHDWDTANNRVMQDEKVSEMVYGKDSDYYLSGNLLVMNNILSWGCNAQAFYEFDDTGKLVAGMYHMVTETKDTYRNAFSSYSSAVGGVVGVRILDDGHLGVNIWIAEDSSRLELIQSQEEGDPINFYILFSSPGYYGELYEMATQGKLEPPRGTHSSEESEKE